MVSLSVVTFYTIAVLLSTLITLVLSVFTWQQRHNPQGFMLHTVVASAAVICMLYAVQLFNPSALLAEVIIGVRALAFSIHAIQVLLFAVVYTNGRDKPFEWRRWRWIYALVVLDFAVLVSNPWHGWNHRSLTIESYAFVNLTSRDIGLWFTLSGALQSALITVAIGWMIWLASRTQGLLRRQTISAAIALAIPTVSGLALGLLENNQQLDIAFDMYPITLALMSLLLGYNIVRHRFLDLLPLAHDQLFQTLLDPVFITDAHWRVVTANQPGLDLCQMTFNELVGIDLRVCLPSLLVEDAGEVTLTQGDTEHHYELQMHGIEQAGEIVGRQVVLRDVTDRVQREAAYHSLVDGSLQGFLLLDGQQILFANERIAEIHGMTQDDFMALSMDDIAAMIHPDDREQIRQRRERRLAGEEAPSQYEYRFTHPGTGEWRWIELTARRVRYQGRWAVQAALIDITDRKLREHDERAYPLYLKAIHALGLRLASLQEFDDIYREATRTARTELGFERVGLLLWDEANEMLLGTYGTDAAGNERDEHDLRIPYIEAIWAHPVERTPGFVDIWESVPLDELGDPLGYEGWRIGTTVWLQDQLHGYFFADNAVSRRTRRGYERELLVLFSATVGNALARLQNENALRKARDAANHANEAKSRFLATMSHELRTPLNAVLGFSEVLAWADNLTEKQRYHLDIINRSGAHLLQLINDVLEISKIEAGEATLNERSFEILTLIEGLHEMFMLEAQKKGLELRILPDEALPVSIRTDEGKLRQVLVNLMSNAIKFTKAGVVTLQLDYDLTSQRMTVEVRDTGVGIAPEELDLLFQPFQQTESGRTLQTGTGLGLPIVKEFVELMGGSIRVDSTVGEGTRFRFSIDAPAEALPEKIRPVPTDLGNLDRLRVAQPLPILVVDDVPTNRDLLTTLLTPAGFVVETADNGLDAIEMVERDLPAIVFMDLHMPVLDGYEAASRIHAEHPHIILIAISASFFASQEQLSRHGFRDYIRKPIQASQIFKVIAKHITVTYQLNPNSPTEDDS